MNFWSENNQLTIYTKLVNRKTQSYLIHTTKETFLEILVQISADSSKIDKTRKIGKGPLTQ